MVYCCLPRRYVLYVCYIYIHSAGSLSNARQIHLSSMDEQCSTFNSDWTQTGIEMNLISVPYMCTKWIWYLCSICVRGFIYTVYVQGYEPDIYTVYMYEVLSTEYLCKVSGKNVICARFLEKNVIYARFLEKNVIFARFLEKNAIFGRFLGKIFLTECCCSISDSSHSSNSGKVATCGWLCQ